MKQALLFLSLAGLFALGVWIENGGGGQYDKPIMDFFVSSFERIFM